VSQGQRLYPGLLLLLALAIGASTSAARPRDESAHAAVACSGYGHPVLKFPTLYAIGKFRCSTGAASATATIVLQGFEHGKWTKIELASREVHALPGKSYTVRTKSLQCT
jgi:hypothetical protein